jgi:GNAT superfamily N-acetyltransferase
MALAYREIDPHCPLEHLADTVHQYWSAHPALWFVVPEAGPGSAITQAIACLWLGRAIDQLTGHRYTHLFLLYVSPDHRRLGLGTALMQRAEAWAQQQGDRQLGLQVFIHAHPARQLYRALGYRPQALALLKHLS